MQIQRELLLKIALKCPDFNINHCLDNIENLVELVYKDTPISREILDHALYKTNCSKKITELNWNKSSQTLVAFKFDSTFITSDQVEKKISDVEEVRKR